MSTTAAAELGAAADAISGYQRRVAELVGPGLGPDRDDLVAAIYEAERSLRTAARLLDRARKIAEH
ncbi:MAG: hypothetical protein ACK5OX_09290 [Desertimonas sp.]